MANLKNSQPADSEGTPVNRDEAEKPRDMQRRTRTNPTPSTPSPMAGAAESGSEEFFRMIVENSEDFFALLDLEGRRIYNSPSYARLFGDTRGMKGSDSFAEIHPADRDFVKRAFRETVQSGHSYRLNFRFLLANGSVRYMESCGALIRNSQGEALRVVVVSRDITDRMAKDQEIHDLAFYDVLTQLPNRRLLSDRLDQAMATSKRSGRYGALLFLDLDNFKLLNDTHGHATGDLLLPEAGRRITGCLRETDTVARLGGDEFVLVLCELDKDKARSAQQSGVVAEKVRAALARPYVLDVRHDGKAATTIEHRCTASIGVVLFRDHEASQDDILKRADSAMYQAKETGGNSIRFYDSKDKQTGAV